MRIIISGTRKPFLQEKKQNKLLFELMYKRGQFMTQEMYDQYNEWENNFYTRWYPSEIEKLELA